MILATKDNVFSVASKIKISDSPAQPKATFLRKSVFLTTGDSSFKFNFNVPPENTDPTVENNIVGNSGSTSGENVDKVTCSSTETQNMKPIKFSNSSSEFKFNFNIEK